MRPSTNKKYVCEIYKESEDDDGVDENDVANERDSLKTEFKFDACLDKHEKKNRILRSSNRIQLCRSKSEIHFLESQLKKGKPTKKV